ncbi:MAG: GNAT family N-acetyltransferase [Bacteroidota bacterium]|nr:N-acetyltransferase [Kiloniellaceae bacterium]
MPGDIVVRESRSDDAAALEKLYPEAFPNEDLLPVVRALLSEGPAVLSLVATAGQTLVGHVAFTTCSVEGSSQRYAMLAPLAVTPGRQRQGIGSALVREGLRRLEAGGTAQVHVLGDPAYYGRFGFTADEDVAPPYPLPPEWKGAWQVLRLRDDAPPARGTLTVPPLWRQPALWAP